MTRYVLLGDGDSPHLLKWARALAAQPGLELWAASSRGFLPGFDACVPPARRLALHTQPRTGGGNVALLRQLPRLARWLLRVDAAWLHAHYLTSHGTLAWLAKRLFGVRARLIGSAWGSDILDTPQRSAVLRQLTRRVLGACALCTSDSQVMATRMRELGAGEVMVFPFGLEALPPAPGPKDDTLFFANRGLEPLYEPGRVLQQFAAVAGRGGRLVVANDGSLRALLQQQAQSLGLLAKALGPQPKALDPQPQALDPQPQVPDPQPQAPDPQPPPPQSPDPQPQPQVQFVGRLDAATQAAHYARARWYLSLPRTDSVAVSVLEAMAHGCVPILSDLPANRELVRDGDNGLLVPAGALLPPERLAAFLPLADAAALRNRQWVQERALFAPSVAAFLTRLHALPSASAA